MSTIRLILALMMLTVSVTARAAETPGVVANESTLDVLANAIRANRKAMVATNLLFSDAEAAAFWPVYDRYEKEMSALGDRLVSLVQDYSASFKGLSNDKAMKLVDEYLTIEADRVKVRRTYVAEFAKILPGRTVARFFQLENKMDAVIRFDLAATIPVVEEESGAP